MGLWEQMTGDGRALLTLRSKDGAERQATLAVEDATARRRLTEPESLLDGLGLEFWRPPVPAQIGIVESGGPAANAGLAVGDLVLSVNGEAVADFDDLRHRIEALPGQDALLVVRRGDQEQSLRVAVGAADVEGRRVGRVGIGSSVQPQLPESMVRHVEVGPLAALGMGTQESWRMTAMQAKAFWRMLWGQVSLKNLSGPLTIAEYAGDSARAGGATFASFLVMISLSLGFLNLLPIPILDGGQVVYQLAEWIKGSPLSERVQLVGQQVGIGLLVLMMGVALFNDILRQFG
jgi:regulator of sigma E protease